MAHQTSLFEQTTQYEETTRERNSLLQKQINRHLHSRLHTVLYHVVRGTPVQETQNGKRRRTRSCGRSEACDEKRPRGILLRAIVEETLHH